MREGDREGRRSSQFKSSPKSGEDSRGQGRGDPRPPSWCGSQDHGGDAAAPGSPTFHARRLQSLKSLLRRRASGEGAAGDHLAHRGPPPGTPGPGRSPWCSPNPLMSSVKTPGSLSIRHHSPALLVMAPATRRPTSTARSPKPPSTSPPPAADLSKTRRRASTPRHPAYFPTASGRRHLPRDGRAQRRSSRPGDVETPPPPPRPLSIRRSPSARREKGRGLGASTGGTSGTLGTPEPGRSDGRGGPREGAGLAPTWTWSCPRPFWPPPPPPPAGAAQGFSFRRRGS